MTLVPLLMVEKRTRSRMYSLINVGAVAED